MASLYVYGLVAIRLGPCWAFKYRAALRVQFPMEFSCEYIVRVTVPAFQDPFFSIIYRNPDDSRRLGYPHDDLN